MSRDGKAQKPEDESSQKLWLGLECGLQQADWAEDVDRVRNGRK